MSCPKGGEHSDIERRVFPKSKWVIKTCTKCGRITLAKKTN